MIDRIIIVGDSWGRGEWKDGVITHRGLEQFLLEDNYSVSNYSQPGADSNLIINQIPQSLSDKDLLVIFATDFQRGQIDWNVQADESLEKFLIHRNTQKQIFLKALEQRLRKQKASVLLLGCLGVLDPIDKIKYKNIEIIHNYVQWLLPNNKYVSEYKFYTKDYNFHLLYNLFRHNKNNELMSTILEQSTLWQTKIADKNIFLDSAHPNRDCHNKLYKYIKEKYL